MANLHQTRVTVVPEGDEEAVVRERDRERVAHVGAAVQLVVVLALVRERVDRVAAVHPEHPAHLVVARDPVRPPAVPSRHHAVQRASHRARQRRALDTRRHVVPIGPEQVSVEHTHTHTHSFLYSLLHIPNALLLDSNNTNNRPNLQRPCDQFNIRYVAIS